jgi:hypothetical protein
MAGYGTARTFATLLGHAGIASVLESTLAEEKATDAKLTGIAEGMVNPEAAAEPPHGDRSGFAARTAEWLGSTAGAAAGQINRIAGRLTGGGLKTASATTRTRRPAARRTSATGSAARTRTAAKRSSAQAPAAAAKRASRARKNTRSR